MENPIPYGHQSISEEDIQAVVEVLRSDFLTQGPMIPAFERAVADYCGVSHAVAVNSATSALHIACLALGVGAGDLVWTSPNTFVASANCAHYCGAEVDFVDIDPRTFNMSIESLREKLIQAEKRGVLPKVVIPVHFSGLSCEMREIKTLSDRFGFRLIEDASHAIGGRYLGEPVGNCRYSDITIFSFHPVKIITTGEGGVATTASGELARKMQLLRSHFITREPDEMLNRGRGQLYYEQLGLGYNYRLTDIQAALGLSQIGRLDQFVVRRHEIAAYYSRALHGFPLSRQSQHEDSYSSYHLYAVCLGDISRSRNEVVDHLRARGILVNIHYIPVHTQPYFQARGFKFGDFPEAEAYYKGAISLPMYPGLKNSELERVVEELRNEIVA